MTSQEMFKHPPIGKDKIFVNVSALDGIPDWQIQDKPADFDIAGNPNNAYYANKIFGYDEKEFLARQYR